MQIKWKDDYSCFEPTIDTQHMKLVELINNMDELITMDDSYDRYDEIIAIFNELKSYAIYHFEDEEKAFERYGYDAFNKKVQVIEHRKFVEKLAAIDIREIDNNQLGTVRELLDFVGEWLTHHILHTDMQFGIFLRDNHKL